MSAVTAFLLAGSVFTTVPTVNARLLPISSLLLQPAVIPVEVNHARKQLGSISQPYGSPWCQGKPTVWMIGHQPGDTERPWCLNVTTSGGEDYTDYDYTDSTWEMSAVTVMDRLDPLNEIHGATAKIDRHDCAAFDVNFDGVLDIVCGVGAGKGKGQGYNEVYLTRPSDASLVKASSGHGLHRWPRMRNRLVITLAAAPDGLPLILFATKGSRRTDGESNAHRMFKLSPAADALHGFHFTHHTGPWVRHTTATCLHRVDMNQDGLDDILMCQKDKVGRVYLQHANGTFTKVRWRGNRNVLNWRNARMADVTGDGVVDLIVVGNTGRTAAEPPSYIQIFRGLGSAPYFRFSKPWYEREMPFATPDVEILDVNHDGIADVYVVQADENDDGTYCGRNFRKMDWWGTRSPQPPSSFAPPVDNAPDLLLVGTGISSRNHSLRFTEVWMEHTIAGCGTLAETFGNNYTMILSHGSMGRPGYTVLLQWY